MAIAVERYNHLGKMLLNGAAAGTLKLMLVDSTYAFDIDHTALASVSTAEITGPGYTAGGETLANVTITSDDTGFAIDADDITWTALTATFRRAILYTSGTVDGVTNPVLASYLLDDTPGDIAVSATDWTVALAAVGIVSGTWS